MAYKVIQINQQEERTDLEPLGTKSKFWYSREGGKWLFKYSRENTGEQWSEKCAAEICKAMDISHVEYELAKADNQWGVTSANFVPEGATLLMGNQLLASFYWTLLLEIKTGITRIGLSSRIQQDAKDTWRRLLITRPVWAASCWMRFGVKDWNPETEAMQ